jgi:hypothetical protein
MAKYKFSKTLKKAGIVFIEILISGSLAYVTETPELIFLAPVFEGLRNYWKNKNK